MTYPPYTFANKGNPNVVPPAGPYATGAELDACFSAAAANDLSNVNFQAPSAITALTAAEVIPTQGIQPVTLGSIATVRKLQSLGFIGDGNSHPVSTLYSTLAEAQVVYPSCVSLTDELDLLAIQTYLNQAKAANLDSFGTPIVGLTLPVCIAIINRPIVTTGCSINVQGQGRYASHIVQTTAGADGWQHDYGTSSPVFNNSFNWRGAGMRTTAFAGVGFRINCNPTSGNANFNDFYIGGWGSFSTAYWQQGAIISASDSEMHSGNVIGCLGNLYNGAVGQSIATAAGCVIGDGITFTSTGTDFVLSVKDLIINGHRWCITFNELTNPGYEGIIMENVNFGACYGGIQVLNSLGLTYEPAEWYLYHLEAEPFGPFMSITGMTYGSIRDCLCFTRPPSPTMTGAIPPFDVFYLAYANDVNFSGLQWQPEGSSISVSSFIHLGPHCNRIDINECTANCYLGLTISTANAGIINDSTNSFIREVTPTYWVTWPTGVPFVQNNSADVNSYFASVNSARFGTGVLVNGYGTVASNGQGCSLLWNRDNGSGATFMINNKGVGSTGGFVFGHFNGTNSTYDMVLNEAGTLSVTGIVVTPGFTIAALIGNFPPASNGGGRSLVSNGPTTFPGVGVTISTTSTGTQTWPVYCDGTNWRYG